LLKKILSFSPGVLVPPFPRGGGRKGEKERERELVELPAHAVGMLVIYLSILAEA